VTTISRPDSVAGSPSDEPVSAPVTPNGPPALTHRQILVVMSGLMLGMFLATLDQTIVGTALPTIAGDFHRQDLLSWVVTVYLLTSTISTPLYGKASDLYGRKRVLQLSIIIFLLGSMLCGVAQSMNQLIAFRALQGLGAGGLMSLALAVIADIIPPRERGRYQGYFGAVFVSSSLIGPLLGGFFVDNASWRWVFYINLPLGLLALVVTNRVLTMPFTQRKVSIDWTGAGLLVAGISALLVAVQSGGRDFAWTSGEMAVLVTAGVLLVIAFVIRERSAVEPILPPRLFGNGSFRVASSIGFLSGAVMFGVIIFLPQYLQLVRGESATVSGLTTIPMLLGVLFTSITSGRLISRIGRYKMFIVGGTFVLTAGLLLMTQISATTSIPVLAVWMFVVGSGMGAFMQTLVMATQSAVETRDLGVATSSIMFFRTMGGAIGAAGFGAFLSSRLASELPKHLPAATAGAIGRNTNKLITSPDAVRALPAAVRHGIGLAYSTALADVFLATVPLALVCVVLAFLLREIKLRSTNGIQRAAAEAGETVLTEPAIL
jgi:EmrB/QacA subfamily drug resistance transporter